MRILLIHNYYQYRGGEETYVESLKKLLEDNGHHVYSYCKKSNDIQGIWNKIQIALGLFWNFTTERELTKIIKEFRPDVAHFNNIYPLIGATAYHVCKKNKLKIVQTIHNYRFMCPKGLLFRKGKICELCISLKLPFWAVIYGCYHQSRVASFFFSLSYFFHRTILGAFEKIDLYIFPSQFTKKYYQSHLHIPEKKAVYLSYFVDLKPPKTPVKKGDYYLFVGRLSEEKGILELLDKFKDMPNKKLKVIGTGPLQAQVDTYKKYKNIHILGFLPRNKIVPILQRAKALIVPSLWYEVLPFVILEALIQGVLIDTSSNLSSVVRLDTKQLADTYYLHHILSIYV